eukprot:9678265-Heterocapsa_arctica.AAC.1
MAVQSHHVKLEQTTAINLGATNFDSDRVVLQPITRIVNLKKMLPWQSGLIRAAAVGRLWTGSRQKQAGYQVDGICHLCFEADDTPFHRLYR